MNDNLYSLGKGEGEVERGMLINWISHFSCHCLTGHIQIRRYLEGIQVVRPVRLALAPGELGGSKGRGMELGCRWRGELREPGSGLKDGPCPGVGGPEDLGLGLGGTAGLEAEPQGELRE